MGYKNWLRFDPLLALLSIPIALFLIFVELDTPKANIPQAVGPEVMPIGILCLIMVNALALFLKSAYGKKRSLPLTGDKPGQGSARSSKKEYQSVILVLVGLCMYGFLVVPLGFILTTAFLIIFEARIFQAGKWIRNVIVGFAFSNGVYWVFVKLLNVMLPAGILG